MLPAPLTPQYVRQTYLRGIDLGSAFQGAGGDAAIATHLDVEVSRAEALMNIQFRPWRVMTAPEPTYVLGRDFDTFGAPIPYVAPVINETDYHVKLGTHDVQIIARVRLYTGLAGLPPEPQYLDVDVHQVSYRPSDETLLIPYALVPDGTTGISWAIDYGVGLGQMPLEIAAWCAIGAAIQVLGAANSGSDLSAGMSATRQVQDGITEDVRFGGHGMQSTFSGMYGPTIQYLANLRDDIDVIRLRFRYQNTRTGWNTTQLFGATVPGGMPAA